MVITIVNGSIFQRIQILVLNGVGFKHWKKLIRRLFFVCYGTVQDEVGLV
jgi:hypothetical protein